MQAVFGLATAPAFFLGTIAAFVSLMSNRMAAAVDRIRALGKPEPGEAEDAGKAQYRATLLRRVRLLQQGIRVCLGAGISATFLLIVLFSAEFGGFNHAYGAGLLFMISAILLAFALFRFAQEMSIGLHDLDHQ